MGKQALAGVRVLDLTHYISGPYCTKLLADYGAEVIKVEKPGEGDEARQLPPFFKDEQGLERSGLFLYLNTNKKSITLNLKTKEGVKLFKELAGKADIVAENFSPGVMSRLGLDYQTLQEINPQLLMVSISNFGQTGPYRDYKATHIVQYAMCGAMHQFGDPTREPVQLGGFVTHYVAGLYGAIGIMLALCHRDKTGVGQHVDISGLEATVPISLFADVAYSYSGKIRHRVIARYGMITPCKDGYIGLNVLTEPHRQLLCALVDRLDLLEDPRFATLNDLWENNQEFLKELEPWLMEHSKEEIFHSGQELRNPIGLIPTTEELANFPQHKAREYFVEVDHPETGKVTYPGAPFKMGETPWQLRRPAPLLGEHNEEIYCQLLGYSRKELTELKRGIT